MDDSRSAQEETRGPRSRNAALCCVGGSGLDALVALPGSFAGGLWLGPPDRMEDGADFVFAQQILGTGDLDDGFAGSDRFLDDFGGLGIADVRVERRSQRNRALRVEVAAALVDGDSSAHA